MSRKISAFVGVLGLALTLPGVSLAGPKEDTERFQHYFLEKFPDVSRDEFVDGVYAIDPMGRESWKAIEEFPPYDPFIDQGKTMWKTPFANGRSYLDCFPDGPAQRKNYPHWDKRRGMVITMELAINDCRTANGEKPLSYEKGPLAALTAYMAYSSRGQTIDVAVPENDPKAMAAYEQGRQFWFARRGQLNFSCANCHAWNAGKLLRSDVLSPALGHATSWPVYRSTWGELGTLHRRFHGCNEQVRAKPFELQGEEYRNLEYFLTVMANGLKFNGPSTRK
ncbi:L-cysteine S-thiosulfotransferase subunit SoxA [Gammaproteobacteria bacterium]